MKLIKSNINIPMILGIIKIDKAIKTIVDIGIPIMK
jgi:hypothetical protein